MHPSKNKSTDMQFGACRNHETQRKNELREDAKRSIYVRNINMMYE
jgi:hypothetical protein